MNKSKKASLFSPSPVAAFTDSFSESDSLLESDHDMDKKPAAVQTKLFQDDAQESSDGYIGMRVKKMFDGEPFLGTVVASADEEVEKTLENGEKQLGKIWKVSFDDGD